MKKLDQRGSGIIEVLVILLVVGAVGFVGWNLWQKHHKAAQSSQIPAQVSVVKNVAPYYDRELKQYYDCLQHDGSRLLAAPICNSPTYGTVIMPLTDNATSLHYITIKEWGIRAPYYGSQDITYTLNDSPYGHYVDFSSKQLDALSTYPSQAASIQKYASNEKVYGEGEGVYEGIAKDVFGGKGHIPGVDHVGDNYFLYIGPQSSHTALENAHDYQIEATSRLVANTIKSLLPNWEAIPAQ